MKLGISRFENLNVNSRTITIYKVTYDVSNKKAINLNKSSKESVNANETLELLLTLNVYKCLAVK